MKKLNKKFEILPNPIIDFGALGSDGKEGGSDGKEGGSDGKEGGRSVSIESRPINFIF